MALDSFSTPGSGLCSLQRHGCQAMLIPSDDRLRAKADYSTLTTVLWYCKLWPKLLDHFVATAHYAGILRVRIRITAHLTFGSPIEHKDSCLMFVKMTYASYPGSVKWQSEELKSGPLTFYLKTNHCWFLLYFAVVLKNSKLCLWILYKSLYCVLKNPNCVYRFFTYLCIVF